MGKFKLGDIVRHAANETRDIENSAGSINWNIRYGESRMKIIGVGTIEMPHGTCPIYLVSYTTQEGHTSRNYLTEEEISS